MAGGDTFGIIVMLVATGVGIAFLDFILRNLPDALDDPSDEIAHGDCPHVPTDLWEGKAGAEMAGRGSGAKGADLRGNQQSHNVSNRTGDCGASKP